MIKDVAVTDCVFESNYGDTSGGAIYIYGETERTTVTNTLFQVIVGSVNLL